MIRFLYIDPETIFLPSPGKLHFFPPLRTRRYLLFTRPFWFVFPLLLHWFYGSVKLLFPLLFLIFSHFTLFSPPLQIPPPRETSTDIIPPEGWEGFSKIYRYPWSLHKMMWEKNRRVFDNGENKCEKTRIVNLEKERGLLMKNNMYRYQY